ncbi:MAG: NAD(P)/FAD-dependent oxidoreductase [Phycisphaeraceae bacterium]
MPPHPTHSDHSEPTYDVVVLGGAISGASLAILLRRWHPEARILIIERTENFDRKVGEATVEVSGMFLSRVLGLYDELSRHHLPKHGLRFWFTDRPDTALHEMTEIGPDQLPTMPSFQLDRARLDEHVLQRAVQDGATLARPAKVNDVTLDWPTSHVRYRDADGDHTVRSRWVIDATGRAGFLARRLDLREAVPEHPIDAAWARWHNTADLDSATYTAPGVNRLRDLPASRRLATNHFCGHGWWAWVIPLATGETSIGVVYDTRRFALPDGERAIDRYETFLRTQPGLGELVRDATMQRDDFHAYKNLSYRTRQYMARGWALVGDAAAFLDPFYSPGLDHVSFSVYATARLLADDLTGALDAAQLQERIDVHNTQFKRSYQRWMRALYLDKYELFSDAEMTAATYCFDIGMYYLGVVGAAYRDQRNLTLPPMGVNHFYAPLAAGVMTAAKRRFIHVARRRRRTGLTSTRQRGWRLHPHGFELGGAAAKLVMRGLGIWLRAECSDAWRLTHRRLFGQPMQDPGAAAAPGPHAVVPGGRDR